jgi:hypothetical protein
MLPSGLKDGFAKCASECALHGKRLSLEQGWGGSPEKKELRTSVPSNTLKSKSKTHRYERT